MSEGYPCIPRRARPSLLYLATDPLTPALLIQNVHIFEVPRQASRLRKGLAAGGAGAGGGAGRGTCTGVPRPQNNAHSPRTPLGP